MLVATALIGAPIGAHYLFPIPLTGDVIDDDSGRTNARREATYLGASHFVENTASALAPLLLVLLRLAGDTRADALGIRLVGPVAGLVVFGGYLLFRRYSLPDADAPASDRAAPAPEPRLATATVAAVSTP